MTTNFRLLAGIFLWLSLLLPASSALADGVGYYPNGTVQWEYLYQDGEVREAKWYDDQGRLNARSTFSNGRQVTSEGYRSDGSLEWQTREITDGRLEITRFAAGHRIEMRYEAAAGQTDGTSTLYYPDGKPRQTVTFQKGTPDGVARTYYESGQVESEYSYKAGQLDGPYRLFSPEGKLTAEYLFENNQLR
jgi:antitoxin component YwqK of YwqJK toxin-antitoxin module